MSWISFFKFGASAKHALVFDIASSSVGVAYITHNHKKSTSPQILCTSRTPIQFGEGSGADALAKSLVYSITKTLEDILKVRSKLLLKTNSFDIHVVIHAPWAESISKTANKTFKQPVKITNNIIEKFVQVSFPEMFSDNSNLVSAHINKITLNDYMVKEPNDNMANSLGVTISVCSMHKVIKQAVMNSITSTLPSRKLHITSFVHAATVLADPLDGTHKEYVLADVGGEYIDLTVIKDGTLKSKTSLEFGSGYLLRAIASITDTPLATAKSKFVMFNENTCTPAERRKIRQGLKEIEEQWAKNFGEACAMLSENSRIPDNIFLTSSIFAYNWFENSMKKIDFAQFTINSKPFKVIPLMQKDGFDTYYANHSVRKDSRLLLASLFVDKYSPNDAYDKLFMV